MPIYWILFFTLIPVMELSLLIKVGQVWGGGPTLGVVILTGVAGAYLAKMQGLIVLRRIQQDLGQGIMPADKLLEGVLIFCSGILMITPGFITDLCGFVGLFPQTRSLIKNWLRRKIEKIISRGRVITVNSFRIFE